MNNLLNKFGILSLDRDQVSKDTAEKADALLDANYDLWLRAGSPPLEWFLGLSDDEQRHIGKLGDKRKAGDAILLAKSLVMLLGELQTAAATDVETPKESTESDAIDAGLAAMEA